jgi:DNA-binding GntR family transcriptional regulator
MSAKPVLSDHLLGPAPRTKSDHAYQVLRRAIVAGAIEADTPLDEDALMARYGLGRTPMREALKRLSLEDFVTWLPHSTPFVRSFGPEDLHRLFEARLVLDEPVARLAAQRLGAEALDDLDRLSTTIETSISSGAIYEAVELDHRLHMAVARGSGNRFLVHAIDRLNCGSLRLWYLAHERLSKEETEERHRPLVDALRAHDPERAGLEARRHVLRFHERQLELLRSAIDFVGPPILASRVGEDTIDLTARRHSRGRIPSCG